MVELQIRNHIAYIELNAPPGNTLNQEFFDSFDDIIESIAIQKDLIGVIISGIKRHFSEGSDIDKLLADAQNDSGLFQKNANVLKRLKTLKLPSIAVIKGICIGSGLELALHCDFRFASSNALLGLPESSFGLIPGLGGISLLQEKVQDYTLLSIVLSGKNLSGDEAEKLGLVDFLADRKTVIFEAGKFIRYLQDNFYRVNSRIYVQRFKQQNKANYQNE